MKSEHSPERVKVLDTLTRIMRAADSPWTRDDRLRRTFDIKVAVRISGELRGLLDNYNKAIEEWRISLKKNP